MTVHNIHRTDTGATSTCGESFTGAQPTALWPAVLAHLRSADLAAAQARHPAGRGRVVAARPRLRLVKD